MKYPRLTISVGVSSHELAQLGCHFDLQTSDRFSKEGEASTAQERKA